MEKEKLTGKLEKFRRRLDKQRIDWNFILGDEASIDERLGAAQMLIKRNFVTLPVWPGKIQPSDYGIWRVERRGMGSRYLVNPDWYGERWFFTEEKYAKSYADYLSSQNHSKVFGISRGVENRD